MFQEQSSDFLEEVHRIGSECVRSTLEGNVFQQNRVNQWSSSLMEQILNQLSRTDTDFKFLVNLTISQRTGGGLQTSSSCFWDNDSDDMCCVLWENESILCSVILYRVSVL